MFPIAARRTSPYDIRVGAVVQYDKLRGYGFIKQAEGADAFVHHTAIVSGGFRSLEQGQTVRYVLRETPKGPQAQNVIVIHNAARLAA